MNDSGLTLGPLALVLAIAAYILKRWWDNADSITTERKRAYSAYFAACHQLTVRAFEADVMMGGALRNTAYDDFQSATPDFYLHASPTVLTVSDVFFERAVPFFKDDQFEKGSDEHMTAAKGLQEALNVLREQMKSEMFTTSPRFQFERWKHRKRLEAFIQENTK